MADSAVPLQYRSQQPTLPHGHGRPPGTSDRWPSSGATPYAPRNSRPSSSSPPPIPVPIATSSATREPRAAPNRYSASTAALASCSRTTGRLSRAEIRSATGAWRHARCGANITERRSVVTKPATARPTPVTRCRVARLPTADTIASSSAPSLVGVGARAVSSTLPYRSTTPARTLVPPMSTPMVVLAFKPAPDLPCAAPGSAAPAAARPARAAAAG